MDSISPLAKILAEANGIDWRSIRGSGESGSVVEQDILNYLSRIMSGDEEPPATPVDEMPEGWTGEVPPMPVNMSGLEALKAAGVESDITDYVDRQAQGAAPQTPPVTEVAPLSDLELAPEFEIDEPTVSSPAVTAELGFASPVAATAGPVATPRALDDADFELDDSEEDELDLPAAGVEPAVPVFSSPAVPEPVEATPVVYEPALPESVVAEPVQAEVMAPTPVSTEPVQLAAPTPAAEAVVPAVAGAAAGFGLGSFLSRLYGNKDTPEAVPSTPESQEATIGSAHGAPAVSSVSAPTDSLPTAPLPTAEPVLGEPLIPQAPPIPDTPVAAPLVADQWRDQEVVDGGRALEPEQPIALPEAHEDETGAPELEAHPEPAAPQPVLAAPELAHPVSDEAPPVVVPAEPAASPAPAPQAAASEALPTLRLNVDLSVLETTRTQLSEALFREVPLSLLVGRAAARSVGTLGLAGPVALGNHAGHALAADLTGDFRASLDALKHTADAQPSLLVLDAAELGLDELHRGALSLSVGRSNGAGTALSLRGDLDPVHGAQFLREVAGLLNTPVRLLF